MKKLLCILVVLVAFFSSNVRTFAQLADGSFAPAFSMVDIDGNTHVLYNYLNAGKPVIIDVSAVWCGPCWSYHNTGALETAYNNWGPSGTDELMVLWIEGDANPLACLQGTGCGTQGNWTAGTPYPLILTVAPNNQGVVTSYHIAYFPTIYVICPNHLLTEVGQANATTLKAACDACPPLPNTVNDAKIYSITVPITSSCSSDIMPRVTIQNYGAANLTSLRLQSKIDGIAVGSPYNWTGNKGRFETQFISLPLITNISDGPHTYTVEASLPNGLADDDTSNNSLSSSFAAFSSGIGVWVKVVTDANPDEVSWKIFQQGTSTIVAQKDNLIQGSNNTNTCLEYNCYNFTIYDAGNNGMGSSGSVLISYLGTTYLSFAGNSYTSLKSVDFCVTQSSIGEEAAMSALSVYPNPFANSTNLNVNLSEPQEVAISVINILGEVVYELKQSLSAGEHVFELDGSKLENGIYIVQMNVDDQTIVKRIELLR